MNNIDHMDLLKKLLELSKTILTKYTELYELEISNLKNTYRYDDIIKEIKELKQKENEIYSKMNEDVLSKTLLEVLKIYKVNQSEIVYILNDKFEKDIALERIYKNLKAKEKQIKINNISDSILCFDLGEEIVIDTLTGTLFYLEQEINNTKDTELKKILTTNKYLFLFSEPFLEERQIENKFKIEDNYYVGSKLSSQIYGIEDNIYEDGIQQINSAISQSQISKLFIVNDNEIDNNKGNYILRKLLLISSLTSLDKENLNDQQEHLLNLISDLKTMVDNNRNKNSLDFLLNIFKELNKYKANRLELSLNN